MTTMEFDVLRARRIEVVDARDGGVDCAHRRSLRSEQEFAARTKFRGKRTFVPNVCSPHPDAPNR